MAKYVFVDHQGLQISGQAGPYFGALLSAEGINGQDVSDNVSDRDIVIQAGVGAAYRIGPGELMLDIRLGFGFSNINEGDSGNDAALDLGSVNNQVLPAFTFGYAFDI